MSDKPTGPRVLISYSHDSDDHRYRIRTLANRLRADGVDAWIDQFSPWPDEGWPRWMTRQIKQAQFVVVVCTASYRKRYDGEETDGGKGVTWEGLLLRQLQYEAHGRVGKVIPTRFPDADDNDIPLELRAGTSHLLPWPLDEADRGYTDLLRRIFRKSEHQPTEIGPRRAMPTITDVHAGLPKSPALARRKHEVLAREQLESGLKRSFDNDGLTRLIRYHSQGTTVVPDMPATWLAPNKFVAAAVEALEKHNALDAEFFLRWREEREYRVKEIDQLERVWNSAQDDGVG